MKVLVLTAFYPALDGTHERMFVHTRNKYYQKNGIDVTVLNFSADQCYVIDEIHVITLYEYEHSSEKYDIAVSHSANVRNHYRFLKKYQSRFAHLVFFFHGYEILYLTKDYPRPYSYDKASKWWHRIMQNIYDKFKITLWRSYYPKPAAKSDYIFVSNWLFGRFLKNTGLNQEKLMNHCHIINNSVGKVFEDCDYDFIGEKKYDFITIRSNLDGSKYGVDIVVKLAEIYPQKKFLLIGQGHYFEYNKKPNNLEWINTTLSHEDMIRYINQSRCALMPTREDTQGVMTCELATFGIPVITSEIEVCHEFFDHMPNVKMISNGEMDKNLLNIRQELEKGIPYEKSKNYFTEKTIKVEVDLFNEIMN